MIMSDFPPFKKKPKTYLRMMQKVTRPKPKLRELRKHLKKVKIEIASIHNEEHIDIPEDEENELRGDKTEARKEEDIPEKENDENPS